MVVDNKVTLTFDVINKICPYYKLNYGAPWFYDPEPLNEMTYHLLRNIASVPYRECYRILDQAYDYSDLKSYVSDNSFKINLDKAREKRRNQHQIAHGTTFIKPIRHRDIWG